MKNEKIPATLASQICSGPHIPSQTELTQILELLESSDNLPKVTRLLGHANLQTTLDCYAELDEGLIINEWQNMFENKTLNSSTRKANHK